MQKFSFAFVCCLMLAFTACKKETLLETNQDLNPKNFTTTTQTAILKEISEAELDAEDSASVAIVAMKEYKKFILEQVNSCFGPISGICGTPTVYHSCYYSYQIWNDPTKLYVDLYFPSSIIGRKTDCYGRTCQYYVTPCIVLDLYNANGTKIGSVNVASSNISVREKRVTFDLAALQTQYPTLKCVKLNGFFYMMKKCTNCNAQRVGTVCISPKEFCLQQCPPPPNVCPTVADISVDKLKVCGSGAIKGTVNVTGDVTKTATIWTVDGSTLNGNTVSIDLPLNSTCSVITKTITAKTICTVNQSVLAERTFNVQINPALTASVEVDNLYCQAIISTNCPSDNISYDWTLGGNSGTGSTVNGLFYEIQTLNYTITNNGCSIYGSSEVQCLPLLKKDIPNNQR